MKGSQLILRHIILIFQNVDIALGVLHISQMGKQPFKKERNQNGFQFFNRKVDDRGN